MWLALSSFVIFAAADAAIILFHCFTFPVLSENMTVKFIVCLDHQQQKSDVSLKKCQLFELSEAHVSSLVVLFL